MEMDLTAFMREEYTQQLYVANSYLSTPHKPAASSLFLSRFLSFFLSDLNLDSRISRFVVRKFALSDHLLRVCFGIFWDFFWDFFFSLELWNFFGGSFVLHFVSGL